MLGERNFFMCPKSAKKAPRRREREVYENISLLGLVTSGINPLLPDFEDKSLPAGLHG